MGGRGAILRALALFLLIPFLCSALILPGTMPGRDAQGRVTVILCGADRPVEMALARDGSLTPLGEGSDQAAPVCVWNLHAQPLLPQADLPVLPGVCLAVVQDLPMLQAPAPVPLRLQVQPARGPPAFA